jgi:hypothetical protein
MRTIIEQHRENQREIWGTPNKISDSLSDPAIISILRDGHSTSINHHDPHHMMKESVCDIYSRATVVILLPPTYSIRLHLIGPLADRNLSEGRHATKPLPVPDGPPTEKALEVSANGAEKAPPTGPHTQRTGRGSAVPQQTPRPPGWERWLVCLHCDKEGGENQSSVRGE